MPAYPNMCRLTMLCWCCADKFVERCKIVVDPSPGPLCCLSVYFVLRSAGTETPIVINAVRVVGYVTTMINLTS